MAVGQSGVYAVVVLVCRWALVCLCAGEPPALAGGEPNERNAFFLRQLKLAARRLVAFTFFGVADFSPLNGSAGASPSQLCQSTLVFALERKLLGEPRVRARGFAQSGGKRRLALATGSLRPARRFPAAEAAGWPNHCFSYSGCGSTQRNSAGRKPQVGSSQLAQAADQPLHKQQPAHHQQGPLVVPQGLRGAAEDDGPPPVG